MDKLKQYFDDHRGEIAQAELPEGDEVRFMAKLSAGRKIRTWIVSAAACAAALTLGLWLSGTLGSGLRNVSGAELLAKAGDDPEAIAMVFKEESEAMCREISAKSHGKEIDNNVRSLSEEAVPMLDQLPDELSDSEKATILRSYYGSLLDGLMDLEKTN